MVLVIDVATGRLLCQTTNQPKDAKGVPENLCVVEYREPINLDEHYYDGSTVVRKPAQPTALHTWDWSLHAWVAPSLDEAEAARLKAASAACLQIDEAVSTASNAPISVQGVRYDADATARENIKGVLDRLALGLGIPSGWLGWRDFDNQQQLANGTEAEVRTLLAELTAAITDRKQRLYAVAWAAKAQILEASIEQMDALVSTTLLALTGDSS